MKTCTKCETSKDFLEFGIRKTTNDGLNNECKACMSERARDHYSRNSERIQEGRALARAANPSAARARDAKYYSANVEKVARYSADYYQANKESRRRYSAAWSQRNPDARSLITQNRRAKVRSSDGVLSKGLTAKLFTRQRGLCPCCMTPLGNTFHLDHVIPIALGGANTDANMQLLRARCNLQKGAQNPIDFMQSRGFLL